MDTVVFADGSVHSCTFCATTPQGDAYVAIDDSDFVTAAAIFSDPDKTVRMEYGNAVLIGFTKCEMLGIQPYGIQAVLRGGHVEPLYKTTED